MYLKEACPYIIINHDSMFLGQVRDTIITERLHLHYYFHKLSIYNL